MKRIWLGEVPIDLICSQEIADFLVDLALRKPQKSRWATYLNAHCFNQAQGNARYRGSLKKAELVYTDGWGLVLGGRLLGHKIPGRSTACDFFFNFCRVCQERDYSLFLLGGEGDIARRTKKALQVKFPKLKIVGSHDGYFKAREEEVLLKTINKVHPDFLIVGMGTPRQEIWLSENLKKLNIKVGWCVGSLFDYIGGGLPRSPFWLSRIGFEWLFRLLVEPKRLWYRYLIGLPVFFYNIFRLRLKRK